MNYKLDVELSKELEPYRSAIEATIKPYVKIELTDNNEPTWWQSKFGGFPYMPKDFDYPKSNDGEYLHLLAQINLAEVPNIESLPGKGILQFYLADDEIWGLNEDNANSPDKFMVIYFPDLSYEEQDLITNFDFIPKKTIFCLPWDGCTSIKFKIDYAPITLDDYKFDIFEIYDYSSRVTKLHDEYWEKFNRPKHKLLGYPNSVQGDPRYYLPKDNQYILLLQIDSDEFNKNFNIMWGDAGIGNFFIDRLDLEKLDFSKVLYNWDH